VEVLGLPYTDSAWGTQGNDRYDYRGRNANVYDGQGLGNTDMTAEAAEAAMDFLGVCDANLAPDPQLLRIIRERHGEGGYSITRHMPMMGRDAYPMYPAAVEHIKMTPYIVVVRATPISSGTRQARNNWGVWDKSGGQDEITVRVRIEAYERPVARAGDPIELRRLGSASGVGRASTGRHLSERVIAYSTSSVERSGDYFAILHGVFDAMSRMKWSEPRREVTVQQPTQPPAQPPAPPATPRREEGVVEEFGETAAGQSTTI